MRGLAFVYDPSGYWIELIDRKLWPVKSIQGKGDLFGGVSHDGCHKVPSLKT